MSRSVYDINYKPLERELAAFAKKLGIKFYFHTTPIGWDATFYLGNHGMKRSITLDEITKWVELSESIERDVQTWYDDLPDYCKTTRGLRAAFSYDECFDLSKTKEAVNNMYGKPVTIKEVIFNKPATIVLWSDGTKTVVKVQGKSKFDKEKGLAMAISKKFLGNKGNYYNEFKKHLSEEE